MFFITVLCFREIMATMVEKFPAIFLERKPVFDGRKNMYTSQPLPIDHEKVGHNKSGFKIAYQYL